MFFSRFFLNFFPVFSSGFQWYRTYGRGYETSGSHLRFMLSIFSLVECVSVLHGTCLQSVEFFLFVSSIWADKLFAEDPEDLTIAHTRPEEEETLYGSHVTFSLNFSPYFFSSIFFPYFLPVLFSRTFSKVATFEIQRFKISVSCFSSTCCYSRVRVPCRICIQTSPVRLPLERWGARMRDLKGPKMNLFNPKKD